MLKKADEIITRVATRIGLGCASVYLFFYWTEVKDQFTPEFVSTLRQGLLIVFGVCLFIAPKGLSQAGQDFIPGLIRVLKLLINAKKNEKDSDT